MSTPSPWYSIKEEVYHTNKKCTAGQAIARADYRAGKGGKEPCSECEALNNKYAKK